MKKEIRTLAALLIASATFVACSSDDNIANENQQPVNPTGKYTMTINASKGDRANTRALDLSGKTLTASWATTENVYVQKSVTWASGSLKPQADGAEATLKGELSGISIATDDVLTLQFPRSGARDYTGQVGTLADIAAKYDYATATVEVEGVSGTGNIIPKSETTAFASQQAIVKFTLLDKADGTTPLNATELVVNDGTTDYTITPAGTSEIYVAIPGFSEQTVTLTATVGSDTYTFEKSGVIFTNGKYYEITVKMAKMAPAAKAAAEATAEDKGKLIGTDGNIYADVAAATAAGTTAVAKIIYLGTTGHATYTHGLALALTDEEKMAWGAAMTACNTTKNTSTPVTNATWLLASKDQWDYMLGASGAGSYTALRDGFSGISGASNLQSNMYWSSTEYDSGNAWRYHFGTGSWGSGPKGIGFRVRACLAF